MLVSTTLAGPGAEASIGDAIRSCTHLVDYHLIALSGAAGGAVQEVLDRFPGLGRCIFRTYEWPNDYGKARTEALRWAEGLGASWALTVDCDERLDIAPAQLAELRNPNYDAWTVTDRDLLYQKPRFLRCGAGLYWEGECAERLLKAPAGLPPAMARMESEFWELPKSEAAEQRRAERGAAAMPRVLAKGEDAHARRHLAECLLTLGRHEEAREHFFIVAEGPGDAPKFERTWCRYRLAEFSCIDGEFAEARALASSALAEDPGLIQELGWILAHTNAQLKDYTAAALWASYALNAPIDYSRGGHRSKTWREGCQKLLANIEAAANRQRPPEPIRLPHDVAIPWFPGLSANMEQVMRSGRYEVSEAAHLLTLLRTNDRVLELGAGCGYLSTLAARRCASVTAVEADPALVEACRATHLANQVEVQLVHGAICGSRLGFVQRAPDFWSSKVVASGDIEVPGVTLAELSELYGPTVLVCDIEGAEVHLLDEKIPASVRAILIETHSPVLDDQIEGWAARGGFIRTLQDGSVSVYMRTS